jgi:hypothetical protein
MLLKAGLLTLLIILLLLVPVQVALSSSSYNLSDYPWLQTGTYMRYQIFNIGTGPDFVLPNGTLLVGLAYSSAQGNMTLAITNRSGDVVDLDINYSITGNATAQGQMFPTEYNYSTSIKVQVDIPTRMAYVDGKPEGIIPFWSVPLPTGGQSVLFSSVRGWDSLQHHSKCGWPLGLHPESHPRAANGITREGILLCQELFVGRRCLWLADEFI